MYASAEIGREVPSARRIVDEDSVHCNTRAVVDLPAETSVLSPFQSETFLLHRSRGGSIYTTRLVLDALVGIAWSESRAGVVYVVGEVK